jgi:hypothetical protein
MIVVIVLVVLMAIGLAGSPSRRLWADKRPGKEGAVNPTGRRMPEQSEFQKPRDEGNLL